MDIRKLNDRLSVAPQIAVDDIPAIAAQGFRTVINNRPENETPDQPATAEIEAAVKAAGMSFLHIPIPTGQFAPDKIAEFNAAYAREGSPILAYCRSGMRSACMWAIAEGKTSGVDQVLSTSNAAGFNIAGVRPIIESNAG